MRISTGSIVGACLSGALLTACSNNGLSSSTPMSVAPQIADPSSQSPAGATARRTHVRPAYSVLCSFGASGDGAYPWASLLNVKGTLYGTTAEGGAKGRGHGTVFSITPSGTETVFYSFGGGGSGDGNFPRANLISVKGAFYGTTYQGGANGEGTVFSVTSSGAETLLYRFKGGSGDGANPAAGLINVNGTLYGMTYYGGANDDGAVFSITTSGTERVLHSFGSGDGALPTAGLINVEGTLYGTTDGGGAKGDGTVFTITPSGTETVVYSFKGAATAISRMRASSTSRARSTARPSKGAGSGCYKKVGCGTVFTITPSGTESVLYSFTSSPDGELPLASLINVKGTLYGTTYYDGANDGGTVFSITTSGTERVLHSFGAGTDGKSPYAGLLNVNGTLYGTTYYGGANGAGTVFGLSS
jgi:uncharacterized repeat protein (TIGR03803 family)